VQFDGVKQGRAELLSRAGRQPAMASPSLAVTMKWRFIVLLARRARFQVARRH
jgi:hypothetical protein